MAKGLLCIASMGAFCVCFPSLSHSQNRAIIWGGNCNESSDADKDFIQMLMRTSMGALYSELKAQEWDARLYYDSDRSAQMKAFRVEGLPPITKTASATRKTLYDSLDLAAKEMKSGEQLLLSVFTHGSPVVVEGQGESASARPGHGWCIQGGDKNVDILGVDDPELTRRLQALKDKGIKLAFADSSCYGGGSIAPLKKYGCVVSTQSALAPAILKAQFSLDAKGMDLKLKQESVGAAAGIMDVMTDMLHKNRVSGKTAPFANLSMEEAYLATLVNFPDRALHKAEEGKAEGRPTLMQAQSSALYPADFIVGERWEDVITNYGNLLGQMTTMDSLYPKKEKLYSQEQYGADLCHLTSDPFPHLERWLQDTVKTMPAEELERRRDKLQAYLDSELGRSGIQRKAMTLEELRKALRDLLRELREISAQAETEGKTAQSAAEELSKLGDTITHPVKFGFDTLFNSLFEEYPELRDRLHNPKVVAKLKEVDPDFLGRLFADPQATASTDFNLNGCSVGSASQSLCDQGDVFFKEKAMKLLGALHAANFDKRESFSASLQLMLLGPGIVAAKAVEEAKALPPAVRGRYDELKDKVTPHREKIQALQTRFGDLQAKLQAYSTQARFYQYFAKRDELKTSQTQAEDLENCEKFVLAPRAKAGSDK